MNYATILIIQRKFLLVPVLIAIMFGAVNEILRNMGSSSSTTEKEAPSKLMHFSGKIVQMLDKSGKSLISSPLSAQIILELLTIGSTNETQEELLDLLGFENEKNLHTSSSFLSSKVKSIKGMTINIANKVYVKQGLTILPAFLDGAKKLRTEVETTSFGEGCVQRINRWAANQTNNKIQHIMSEGSVDSSTQMVVINALYFKGTWKKKFLVEDTSEMEFHVNSNKTVMVEMMTHPEDRHKFGISLYLDAEILLLPYAHEKAYMAIVLPNHVEGLASMLEKLAAGYDLIAEVSALKTGQVEVTIPKFTTESEINLTRLLEELGVKYLWITGADKMVQGSSIPVSYAVQKAFIEVNEDGTEAAAVTAATVTLSVKPQFHADRPFLYMILGPGKVALFVGTFRGDGGGSVKNPMQQHFKTFVNRVMTVGSFFK